MSDDATGPEVPSPESGAGDRPAAPEGEERQEDQSGAAEGHDLDEDVHDIRPRGLSGWLSLVISWTIRSAVDPRLRLDLGRSGRAARARDWRREVMRL